MRSPLIFASMAEDQAGAVSGPSIMALSSMVPVFTGDGKGVTVQDFVDMVEQVAVMGSWKEVHKLGVARCRVAGVAYDFVWRDERAKDSKTFADLRAALLKRFDTELPGVRLQRFLAARQRDDEDVQTYATRLQSLGTDTLRADRGGVAVPGTDDRAKIARELMREQLCSQFVQGLKDPIRRFVLSRRPERFEEAVEVATQEEANESLASRIQPVRMVGQPSEVDELRERLARLETLFLQREERPRGGSGNRGRRTPRCYSCGEPGHFARECDRQTAPRSGEGRRDTVPKNV